MACIDRSPNLTDNQSMPRTVHAVLAGDARSLSSIPDKSISLVVTSPPYPMIEMWDDVFARMNPEIPAFIENGVPGAAFSQMHQELDRVWTHLQRVLMPGGFACINIGDATRTIRDRFQLFPNAERVTQCFMDLGFDILPRIIWRKTTNAPNKFMGSGMLPAGAYVTLEHEYILIFRNGAKRRFTGLVEKQIRHDSAFFWEERNAWFSDVWFGLNGAKQSTSLHSRERNGAYPVELPFRLINMFSVKGDTVLDPFLGTGTTTMAAIASARNSVGMEVDHEFVAFASNRVLSEWPSLNELISARIGRHKEFVENARKERKALGYFNQNLDSPVMTRQERNLSIEWIRAVSHDDKDILAEYAAIPPKRIGNPQMTLFEMQGG